MIGKVLEGRVEDSFLEVRGCPARMKPKMVVASSSSGKIAISA